MDESADPTEESGRTVTSDEEEVEETVAEDMARFQETFVGINKRFRLINRIGEGSLPHSRNHTYQALRFLIVS